MTAITLQQSVHLLGTALDARSTEARALDKAGYVVRAHGHVDDLVDAVVVDPHAACAVADLTDIAAGGDDLLSRLNAAEVYLPVVLMDDDAPSADVVRRLKSGAVDYLLRPVAAEAVVAAVQAAALLTATYRQVLPLAAAIPARLARLTNREREVLAFLVQGLSTKEIGRALGVSPRTIEVHRGRLMTKMQARNGVDLVRLVMAAGSGPPPMVPID